MPSSLSVAITAANDAATDPRSLRETRSSGFRQKIHLRTSSPTATGADNGRRKVLLSVSPEHTETTPSRLNINKNRSRGSSGSSLLNPAVIITSPPQPAPLFAVTPTTGGALQELTVTSSSCSSEINPQAERVSAIEPEPRSTDNHPSSSSSASGSWPQADSNGSSVIRSLAVRYLFPPILV
jgi:hypothetical protein